LKVLLLNTYDTQGGAAIAATRLWKGLLDQGVDAHFMVQEKFGRDPRILGPATNIEKGVGILRPHIDRLPLAFYPNREKTFWSVQWLPGNIIKKINEINPDVVHLHWICNGYLPIQALPKIKQPIVWTLHDSWAFTGGCHVPQACEKFKSECHRCPQLNSGKRKDLSYRTFKKKQKYWKDIDITLVCPSHWVASNSSQSLLFHDRKIKVIPHGINTSLYKPIVKKLAREILNLPQDKQLILFGALKASSDKNKGYHLLKAALAKYMESFHSNFELLLFGAFESESELNINIKANFFGHLNDDLSLAILYSAADVMVVPSLQESFGQTALEAMACGTPVVAFNATGLMDIVKHEITGYLANPYEANDLAYGIEWTLKDMDRLKKMQKSARESVLVNFTIEKVAAQYKQLYKEALA
jgi:glycosyltransferase involved in cell wall biosynthesis